MFGWVRGVAATLAVGFAATIAPDALAERIPADPGRPQITFEATFQILRNGERVGEHRYIFVAQGNSLTVVSRATATVTLFGLPVYRFTQQVREVWHDGRLTALDADTDDNGERARVTARATTHGLTVEGPLGRAIAAASAVPTTYWNVGTVRGAQLIDTRDGEVMNRSVTPLAWERITAPGGITTSAQRYRISGRTPCDVWYDAEGLWRRLVCDTEHGRIEDVRTQFTGDREHFTRLLSIHYGGDERLAQGQPAQ
jgi:hypothetical protein